MKAINKNKPPIALRSTGKKDAMNPAPSNAIIAISTIINVFIFLLLLGIWAQMDSNQNLFNYELNALPLSYKPLNNSIKFLFLS